MRCSPTAACWCLGCLSGCLRTYPHPSACNSNKQHIQTTNQLTSVPTRTSHTQRHRARADAIFTVPVFVSVFQRNRLVRACRSSSTCPLSSALTHLPSFSVLSVPSPGAVSVGVFAFASSVSLIIIVAVHFCSLLSVVSPVCVCGWVGVAYVRGGAPTSV